MTMQRWMEAVGFRITEGSTYGWNCYGPNAYTLDSWNGEHDGHSFSIIFDTKDQVIYEIQAHDFANNRAYRWLAETYKDGMLREASDRAASENEAWDGVNYTDLEVLDDLFEKIEGIRSGAPYDTRVQVPIDLPDNELFQLMVMAHERDITLNQMVEEVLKLAIERAQHD